MKKPSKELQRLRDQLFLYRTWESEDRENFDPEDIHPHMDQLLLDYIGDEEVTKLFKAITKYYA